MLTIGLTGGIASGKSTVSRILRELGAPVIDADAIVHQLQAPGEPVTLAIAAEFGPGVVKPDGSLDRGALGQIVFASPERRKVLESIVHPAVRSSMFAQRDRHRQEGAPAVVLDVPLLIEGGMYKEMDQVWLVYADAQTQLQRLMARDGMTEEAARKRIAAQMDLELKRAYAQVIIDNRGSVAETRFQVEEAWTKVMADLEG